MKVSGGVGVRTNELVSSVIYVEHRENYVHTTTDAPAAPASELRHRAFVFRLERRRTRDEQRDALRAHAEDHLRLAHPRLGRRIGPVPIQPLNSSPTRLN